jgi:hypothetical protein
VEGPLSGTENASRESEMGHGEKNSRRAYLFCIAPITGIHVCPRAGLSRARSGHSLVRSRTARNRPFAEVRLKVRRETGEE